MKMECIETTDYEMPEHIRQLEIDNDKSQLNTIEKLFQETEMKSENSYVSRLSALIHMEEAACTKRLSSYDLKNVQLLLKSRKNRTFIIGNEVITKVFLERSCFLDLKFKVYMIFNVNSSKITD